MKRNLWIFLLICVVVGSTALARAGGGGGGDEISGLFVLAIFYFMIYLLHSDSLTLNLIGYCILAIPVGMIGYSIYIGSLLRKRKQVVRTALQLMAKTEPQWSEENLISTAKKSFNRLQAAWGKQDLEMIKSLLTYDLYVLWETEIQEQKNDGITNVLTGLSIDKIMIVAADNYQDDEKDNFTVCFDASANEQYFRHGKLISSESTNFREFWTFQWHEGHWLLAEVTQSSGWKRFVSARLVYEPPVAKKAAA